MITSVQNVRIKRVCALQQKQKERNSEGVFVVEGKKMMEETPVELIEEVFVTDTFYQHNKQYLDALSLKSLELVTDKVLLHMSTLVTPQGILGVVRQRTTQLNGLNLVNKPLLIALDNIQDPGNMGTIIRTADAINAQGVIISAGSVDIYNPKVVRATMGSIFRVPIIIEADLVDVLMQLSKRDIRLYAAHLKGDDYYYSMDYKESTCFLIGNEGNGLSEEVAALASSYIKIPILGQAESLNAAVAAGILMYEAVRQREQSTCQANT
ncbi:MAG: 23S rRNA (guanosine(2251)-2'-O)-methyltransferase RlmB [Firmicutes bacterium HGW-Firmicutes-1]|jgi:TrmH family RNA methyltransferase|nr:MAG: 23S rRNA (guanosine(2251)-2'-O)-methyltransferase RlmB [Firmicutes bacterium HGW-Firmicutes-1]